MGGSTATLTIDGVSIALERTGTGPPLLLVHGLGGPAMNERLAPILSARFDLLLPHLPGFGESPPASNRPGAADHAALLSRLLDTLGIGRAAIAGISYGGEIAARLAASRPGLASVLVLVSPTGAKPVPAPLRSALLRTALLPVLRRALTRRRVAEWLSRRSFHDPAARPAGLVERHLEHLRLPGRLDALLNAIDDIWSGRGELPGIVAGVGCPLTLAWGEADRTVSLSTAGPLFDARPDAELVVVPGAGHSVSLERPSELAAAIAAAAERGASTGGVTPSS